MLKDIHQRNIKGNLYLTVFTVWWIPFNEALHTTRQGTTDSDQRNSHYCYECNETCRWVRIPFIFE